MLKAVSLSSGKPKSIFSNVARKVAKERIMPAVVSDGRRRATHDIMNLIDIMDLIDR